MILGRSHVRWRPPMPCHCVGPKHWLSNVCFFRRQSLGQVRKSEAQDSQFPKELTSSFGNLTWSLEEYIIQMIRYIDTIENKGSQICNIVYVPDVDVALFYGAVYVSSLCDSLEEVHILPRLQNLKQHKFRIVREYYNGIVQVRYRYRYVLFSPSLIKSGSWD